MTIRSSILRKLSRKRHRRIPPGTRTEIVAYESPAPLVTGVIVENFEVTGKYPDAAGKVNLDYVHGGAKRISEWSNHRLRERRKQLPRIKFRLTR